MYGGREGSEGVLLALFSTLKNSKKKKEAIYQKNCQMVTDSKPKSLTVSQKSPHASVKHVQSPEAVVKV